ncbi:cupin domain-containing protein [Dankookia sp. P2]|uniref:cupin domain-containing protein n=1 Tax=Dankookia sp. P2 TaxID=3423955 RepID=UPI003D66D9D2
MPDFAPIIRLPGEGTPNRAFGERLIRIRASETAGRFAVIEEPVPPGWGPPLHVHAREDEFFQVLEGTFRFRCGDAVQEGGVGTAASPAPRHPACLPQHRQRDGPAAGWRHPGRL